MNAIVMDSVWLWEISLFTLCFLFSNVSANNSPPPSPTEYQTVCPVAVHC